MTIVWLTVESSNNKQVSKYMLVTALDRFKQQPSKAIPPALYGQVQSQFALGIALYHGWGVLNSNGLRGLHLYLKDMQEKVTSGQDTSKAKKALLNMQPFKNLMLMLDEITDKVINHPKLEKVVELITEHFRMEKITFCSG